MKIEIFIPVLLKFSDDSVVFKDEDLDVISEKVFANFDKNENALLRRNHLDYFLKEETLEILMNKLVSNGLNISTKDIRGEFYYYHHRIIIKFVFQVADDFNGLRKLRSGINEFYPKFIKECVLDHINNISSTKSKFFYSYMMIIIPKNKHQLNNYTDKLGSVTFSIIESTNRFLSYGYTHYARISIPSLNVYYDKEISNDIKVDLINLIYQNLLNEKKLDDKGIQFSDNLYENLEKYNCIDESKLTSFWNNTMEMLGGKISEKQAHNIDKHNYYLTLIGLFISGIVLGQTIYDYFGMRYLLMYFGTLAIALTLFGIARHLKVKNSN